MSSDDNINFVIDDIASHKNLVSEFPIYGNAITSLILNSAPQITVGIYGEWGSGKTSLMMYIKNEIEYRTSNKVKTVWFNAWRFEREKSNATIPLLLSMLVTLYTSDEISELLKQKSTEKEPWKNKWGRIIRGLSGSMTVGIPGLVDISLSADPNNIPEKKSIEEKQIYLEENKTTLQEGLDLLEESLKLITKSKKDLALVVFIDDLDRCLPEKALEVFESTKIFFDSLGIIFVLGISREIIVAAINEKYKHLGTGFDGDQYLKKIIQLPFFIPNWTRGNTTDYINHLLKDYSPSEDKKTILENLELISKISPPNPREIKRYLNSLILTNQIYGMKEIPFKILLISQALEMRWNEFYMTFIRHDEFRQEIEHIIKLSKYDQESYLSNLRKKKDELTSHQRILLGIDEELWKFLTEEKDSLFKINKAEWKVIQEATSTAKQFQTGISKDIIQKANSMYSRGLDLRNEGKHEEAIKFFNQMLDMLGYDRNALITKGNTLYELKRFEDAISCYRIVLANDPREKFAINNIGRCLFRMNKFEDAIEYHSEALDIDPDWVYPMYFKAACYSHLLDVEKSLIFLERCSNAEVGTITQFISENDFNEKVRSNPKFKEIWKKITDK